MTRKVTIFDQDIRMSIFFLCNLATILEFMQRNLRKNGKSKPLDINYYKQKMDAYEEVFDAVIDDFNDSMFGEYSNAVSRDVFQKNLMHEGWKYFELDNLNELFKIEYDR